jgi:hypothetical protein
MNRLRREWWVSASVAMVTLALHALLVASLSEGTTRKTLRKPDVTGPGASALASSAEAEFTMVLIDLSEGSLEPESALDELSSQGTASDELSVRILSPDPNPTFDYEEEPRQQDEESAPDSASDVQSRARMFGRYMNQVSARIERAWLRPATESQQHEEDAIEGDENIFNCQVRVLQDGRGKVQEVMLLDCNGSRAWQQSLVIAIEQASPLPAPPHPSVFASALTLRFEDRLELE